ncbi:MAG TPA: amino acid adenylation domain-containing protein [Thermoanaerobaculia bacterium]|nr:amino acid adenylation domain-containing protein [Thermoanaerobaculia bacterium]
MTMQPTLHGFKLSPQQSRAWELIQADGEAPYRLRFSLRLTGALDRERLSAALSALGEQREILRTSFSTLPGLSEPLQVIDEPSRAGLRWEDLAGWSPAAQDHYLAGLLRPDRQAPLPDGLRGPAVEAVLCNLSAEEAALVVSASPLVFDLPSIALWVEQVSELYGGAAPTPGAQVADVAEWQNQILAEEDSDGPALWHGGGGDSALPALPGEVDQGAEPFRSAVTRAKLGDRRSVAVAAAAERSGVAFDVFVCAAWQALLSRLLVRPRWILGIDLDGRNYEELRGVPGPLSRQVPVELGLPERESFAALLAQVRGTLDEAARFQERFSWKRWAGAAAPASLPIGFAAYDWPEPRVAGGLRWAMADREACTAGRSRLHLTSLRRGGERELELRFDSRRFDPAHAARLLDRLLVLLDSAALDPEMEVGELALVGEAELHHLLRELNDTRRDLGAERLLHRLVERQVERTPDALAVASEAESLSFRELDGRADRLARRLLAAGIGPGEVVAVALERGVGMIVALLAVLKAGAGYLPIEPTTPADRFLFMTEDAEVEIIVTELRLETVLPATTAQRLYLDQAPVRAWPASRPAVQVDAESLAYVIFTSGSTGRPKGVMVPHRAIVNRLLWMQASFPLRPGDSVLQKTPFTFDASVWELFCPLLAGARLVFARADGQQEGAYLVAAVLAYGITTLQLVPSVLEVFLRQPEVKRCSSLRRFFSGGEALAVPLAERLRSLLPDVAVTNLYGPTETAIDATSWSFAAAEGSVVAIGRPIANLSVLVLDPRLRLAPAGAVGELYIGGTGVARGYLGRPDLTAERFLPHPFSEDPGAILYHSGDLARWRPDSVLEHLGRADRQVKVRGIRVELGEIEATLRRHPFVSESVALVRDTPAGERQLVAFVTPAEEEVPTPAELRAFLRDHLLEGMAPSTVVVLDAMPLLPNGKLDRQALAALSAAQEEEAPATPPRTPVEQLLAAVWGRLLNLERIDSQDDFFASGGHSLLATELVAEVKAALGVDLTLRAVFEHPVLEEMAALIDSGRRAGQGLAAGPIERVPRGRPYPLSFGQERLWFLDQLVPGSSFYNIHFAVGLFVPVSPAAVEWTLQRLFERHESLRTRFELHQGKPVQVVDREARFALAAIDLGGLLDHQQRVEAERLAQADARRPFALDRGGLLRVLLLLLREDERLLVCTMHHIITDAWSIGILVSELSEILAGAQQGRAVSLPELPIQCVDFAAWQRERLRGEVLERQLDYWRRQLAGAPEVSELPTDHPRPPFQTFRGANLPFRLRREALAPLRQVARQARVSHFMLLLAAFKTLLFRYSGRTDIVVGSPIADRGTLQLRGVVGFFLNTLALRSDLSGPLTFGELLNRVREVALGAFTHQDLPFELLVEELRPERNLSHQPIFQTMFAHQQSRGGSVGSTPVAAGSIEIESDSAKFDLTLSLEETERELLGSLEYSTDLFETSTAARMLTHFGTLLDAIAADPQARLTSLPLLGNAERQQILLQWNDTQGPVPGPQLIHRLFERQAARQPEAVAALCDGRLLTYGELNRQANRLAQQLGELGIGRGQVVAVLADRSLEMVAALLAVLKAGGAYLPIEPSLPRERVAWLLAAQQVSTVLTQHRHLSVLLEPRPGRLAHLICLDEGEVLPAGTAEGVRIFGPRDLAGRPADNPALPDAAGSDTAYVIFTSGSTGEPKAVVVQHQPVTNLIDWVNRRFEVEPRDRVLLVSSLSFDLSVYDIFGLLAAGGSIAVATNDDVQDPQRLVRHLTARGVTFWDSAPAALQQLVPFLPAAAAGSSLRLVFLSGDWIPVSLPDRVRAAFPGARVVALGGATEATVWSNFFPVGEIDPSWVSIPYGRPIQNARYYALDSEIEPCPIGVAGDLYIGGGCLFLAYGGDPALTAWKLIPDPYGGQPGARLYRTGDRVRYGSGGVIEFLGRSDTQVKIRGFRIELGEIEVVLSQHPGVDGAVVRAARDEAGERRLVAYVVPRAGEELDASDLRRYLGGRLPAYMLPASFLFLAAFPVTLNGKLDTRALPLPGSERPALEAGPEPPRDAMEWQLLSIWEGVLGLSGIGVTDSFFDLGGHSLLAVRLMSRLNAELGRNLPLATLFRAATVRGFAELVREVPERVEKRSVLVSLRDQGEKPPLYCVHPIGGHVLCYAPLARQLGGDRPVVGIECPDLDSATPATVEGMAALYVEAVLAAQPAGPYFLSGLSSGGVIAFEMARQLVRDGHTVGLVALLDSRPPALHAQLDSLLADKTMILGWVHEVELSTGRDLGISAADLASLPLDDQLVLVLARMKDHDLLPAEVSVATARDLLRLVRHNLCAVETYQPQVYSGRVRLFRAAEELSNRLAETEESRRVLERLAQQPAFGWSRYCAEPIEIEQVPGNHLTMAADPHVTALAAALRRELAKAEAAHLAGALVEPAAASVEGELQSLSLNR